MLKWLNKEFVQIKKEEELVNSASKTAFQEQFVNLHSCRLLLAPVMEPPKVDFETSLPDHGLEILEPIKVEPIVILSHADQNERETTVDDYKDENGEVEWDFIFGVDILLPTLTFCIETMILKHTFPWYDDLAPCFAM